MNNIRFDWLSLGIIGIAIVFRQINSISLRFRYLVLAAAVFAVGVIRMQAGGSNQMFALAAFAFGVYYVVQAIRAKD